MRMGRLVCWAVLLPAGLLAAPVFAEDAPPAEAAKPPEEEKKLPETYQGKPFLLAPKVELPKDFKLTGDVTHGIWKKAVRVSLMDNRSGEHPEHQTVARLFCTDEALYFGIKCRENEMSSLLTEGDMWEKDSLELFFEPCSDLTGRMYHQILVDTKGAFWTSRIHLYPWVGRHGDAKIREDWHPAIEIVAGKGKDYWAVEVKLAFSEMALPEEARTGKTLWRLNMFRRKPRGWEHMAWAITKNHSFHKASCFGYFVPEVKATPELLEFIRKTAAQPAEAPKAVEEAQLRRIRLAAKDLYVAKSRDARKAAWKRIQAFTCGTTPEIEALDKAVQEESALAKGDYHHDLAAALQRMIASQKEAEREDRLPPNASEEAFPIPKGDPLVGAGDAQMAPKPPEDF
jgi:hypothetical protein